MPYVEFALALSLILRSDLSAKGIVALIIFFPKNNAAECRFNFKNKLTNLYLRNYYSTVNNIIHPAFITGFTDGEECFVLSITKNKSIKVGWLVRLFFHIELYSRDSIIKRINSYFHDIGLIRVNSNRNLTTFVICSFQGINLVIHHFEKYPLISEKCAYFELWRDAFKLMECK